MLQNELLDVENFADTAENEAFEIPYDGVKSRIYTDGPDQLSAGLLNDGKNKKKN